MIIRFNDLEKIRADFKESKIVYSGGTWDLLHPGHIHYFEKMKDWGDVVVIAVSPDVSVKQRKGENRPIFGEDERLLMVDSVRCVDYALISPAYTEDGRGGTVQCLLKLKPDIFVSGDEKWVKWVESRNEIPAGTETKIIPRSESVSTSEIIEKIARSKERV